MAPFTEGVSSIFPGISHIPRYLVLKHLHIHWHDVGFLLGVVFWSLLNFFLEHVLPEVGRGVIRELVKEGIVSLKQKVLRPKTLRPTLVNATVNITGRVKPTLIQASI